MITNQIVPFRSVRRGPVHRAEVVRRGVRNCHQDKHRSRQIDIQPPHTTPRPVAYLCYYYTDTIIIIKIQERKNQQQQQKTTNKQTDQSLNISTNPREKNRYKSHRKNTNRPHLECNSICIAYIFVVYSPHQSTFPPFSPASI